jgi:aminopeptidase N
LEPNIETSTSTGSVKILTSRDDKVKDLQPIVFDINEIEITSCKVEEVDRADIEISLDYTCEYGKNNESYVINLKKNKFSPKNLTVHLDFVSKLGSTLTGFYKSSFENDETKEKSWLLSTQFSPIDARRAFPCVDRPYAKATFKISLIRPIEKKISISNMPIESTE